MRRKEEHVELDRGGLPGGFLAYLSFDPGARVTRFDKGWVDRGVQSSYGHNDRSSGFAWAVGHFDRNLRCLPGVVHDHPFRGFCVTSGPGLHVVALKRDAERNFAHARLRFRRHFRTSRVNGAGRQSIFPPTNGIESSWSVLKRAYDGTFHWSSRKHLDRYVTEFAGRHNIRDMDTVDQMTHLTPLDARIFP